MIRRLTPLFSLVLALSCGSPTVVVERFKLGEPFELRVGQEAVSANSVLSVRFLGVVTDSRCPVSVVCVWAGEAIIEVLVTRLTASQLSGALEVTVASTEPVIAQGVAVHALDLTRRSTEPGALVVPTAQLRVDALP